MLTLPSIWYDVPSELHQVDGGYRFCFCACSQSGNMKGNLAEPF